MGLELKYAWRLLRKNWSYSLLCALVVALSAGLAGWASVVVYNQLFKSLEFPGADRWYSVQLGADAATKPLPAVDAYTYQELLKRNRTADHLGAYASRSAVLSEGEASTTLRGGAITPRLLAATAVQPHLGRVFEDADGQPGAAPVAVLSFVTWQTYFAADPAIAGKTARIDGQPVRIAGVMPQDFYAFQDFEIWFPLRLPQMATPRDSTMSVTPLIVLRPNQTVDSVRNEMRGIVGAVNKADADLFNPGRYLELFPAVRMFNHQNTPIVWLMVFLAAAILLLGCMNVSMVFLARLLERSRELAMRKALGATRGRLLRQCLLESALILPPALIAGYGIARGIFAWVNGLYGYTARIMAEGTPPKAEIRPVDILVACIAAIVIWMLSTLIPAWRVSRQDVAEVIAGAGKGSAGSGRSRSTRFLVGLEVVISSLVLMVAWGLVVAVKLELNKRTVLDTGNVLIATHTTNLADRYTEPAGRVRYWDDLTAAIQSRIQGSEVAYATSAPSVPASVAAAIETQEGAGRQGTLRLRTSTVSDSYFKLLGMNLRSGRLFDSTDNAGTLPVAIVDERMATRYWPGQNVLGKRIQLKKDDQGTWLTIVGVVSAVQGTPYAQDNGVVYQSLRQVAPPAFRLIARVPNATADSRAALRAAAFSVDRDVPLRNLQTLDDYLGAVNLSYTALIPAFLVISGLTALLAASGVFGLISRTVAQRTQEVGIRRALGATPWKATSRFMRQGATYVAVSIIGIAFGLVVTNGMRATFTNILDSVLLVTLAVVLLLSAVIFAASYLPSRRALALEPGEALRYE